MIGWRRFDEDEIDPGPGALAFLRKPLGVMAWLLSLPVHLLNTIGFTVWTFLAGWVRSRPLPALLRGLPFVWISLAVLFLLLEAGRVPDSKLIRQYQQAAVEASERGDTNTATLWLEKTALLDPNEPLHQFHQALMADEDGQRDRARQIMRRIAPTDGEGYPRAHYWLARDLIDQSLPLTPELAQTIEHHLAQSLRYEGVEAESHAMLGQLLAVRRDVSRAVSHFEEAAAEKPDCHLALAVLYTEQQQPEKAARAASRAADYYTKLVEAEPETEEHRLRLGQSHLFARNFVEAVDILQQALDNVEDPEPFRKLLVAAHLGWLGEVTRREPKRLDKQLDILNGALKYGPEDAEVLALVAKLTTQEGNGAYADQAAELHNALTRALASGSAPPLVHVILGTRALEEGDAKRAVTHLELAHEASPETPIVLNNLAWGLARQEEPDLDRALRLVETAIPLSDHPNLHGTRAVILSALGRSQEAITELEAVLRRHPDPAWVHEQLADLYRQAGIGDLATQHAQFADRIRELADQ